MRDVNSVILTGRIGKELELKSTPSGKSVCNFSLAVVRDESVDWIYCVAWDKGAEALTKFAHKGDRLTIQGRLMVREFEHNGENRKVTEVTVEKIVFSDKREYREEPAETSDDLPF